MFDLVDDRLILFLFRPVDNVWIAVSMQLLVSWDRDDVQFVDFPEFTGLGHGGTGHSTDLVVQFEEVL